MAGIMAIDRQRFLSLRGRLCASAVVAKASPEKEWIDLFDGKTLDGRVHLNGWHTYTVEDGAIVGRTVSRRTT
jgi:hypothetical protein